MRDTSKRYAWEWTPYGVATDGQTGAPIGRLHIFTTWQERDAWVREAADIPRTEKGHREALSGYQGDKWRRYDEEPIIHDEVTP